MAPCFLWILIALHHLVTERKRIILVLLAFSCYLSTLRSLLRLISTDKVEISMWH